MELGQVVITRGAIDVLSDSDIISALGKYTRQDWGEVCKEDQKANDFALENNGRILAAYRSAEGSIFWIITEADRSVTTILLPSEY